MASRLLKGGTGTALGMHWVGGCVGVTSGFLWDGFRALLVSDGWHWGGSWGGLRAVLGRSWVTRK